MLHIILDQFWALNANPAVFFFIDISTFGRLTESILIRIWYFFSVSFGFRISQFLRELASGAREARSDSTGHCSQYEKRVCFVLFFLILDNIDF